MINKNNKILALGCIIVFLIPSIVTLAALNLENVVDTAQNIAKTETDNYINIFIFILTALGIWTSYITIKLFANMEVTSSIKLENALSNQTLTNLSKGMDSLNMKLDMFLRAEIDELKEIAELNKKK